MAQHLDVWQVRNEVRFLGPDSGMRQAIKVLNRAVRCSSDGIQYEAAQRHTDIIIKAMDVEDARPMAGPGTQEPREEAAERERAAAMPQSEATMYRGIAARLNYLSLGRVDLHLTANPVAPVHGSAAAKVFGTA